jgi:hypothetical protein
VPVLAGVAQGVEVLVLAVLVRQSYRGKQLRPGANSNADLTLLEWVLLPLQEQVLQPVFQECHASQPYADRPLATLVARCFLESSAALVE